MNWPEARSSAPTLKDMVREMSATNFTNVEDEVRYWLEHFDVSRVHDALQDAGYGFAFADRVMADVLA